MSPLGPIRLEWGFNLDPEDDENNDKIEFSLGGFF
jgi:outer membrane protein insertion porin family